MNPMTPTIPEWLAKRGGELRRGPDDNAWLVLLSGSLQYRAVVTPAKGQFACAVTQAVSGKRLDRGAAFPTAAAALEGGLADLREALGW
jgi:hypothetical protein